MVSYINSLRLIIDCHPYSIVVNIRSMCEACIRIYISYRISTLIYGYSMYFVVDIFMFSILSLNYGLANTSYTYI